jgi:argininosuccinate lyase
VNLDRLAEDLQIFSTAEFGLLELADRHTRTSVIMPQKKNPYALAYIRGVCGEAIGTLAAQAALGKTPSGQIDNRIFAYGSVPRALDAAIGAVRLLADVLRGLVVRVEPAAQRAAEGFSGATDLAEVIMLQCGLDYKVAHDLVARAVSDALETGQESFTLQGLEAAAQAAVGHTLELSSDVLRGAVDPARIVASRTGLGGAAEPAVAELVAEFRRSLAAHIAWREAAEIRLAAAEMRLLMAATALKSASPLVERPDQPEPGPSAEEPDPLDPVFGDLPRPPRVRRWREQPLE